MKKNIFEKISLFLISIFISALCFSNEIEEDEELKEVKNNFFNQLLQPFRQMPYTLDSSTRLSERIKSMPDSLFNFCSKQHKDIYDNINYKIYSLSEKENNIMKHNLDLLPEDMKSVLKEKLIGIYFIKNLNCSGFASWVVDENNDMYCYITINPDVLNYSISEFLTMKERSVFDNNGEYDIDINISGKHNAVLYLLLHEGSHVVDYIENITPCCEIEHLKYLVFVKKIDINYLPMFIVGNWEDFDVPVKNNNFLNRDKIGIYAIMNKNNQILNNSDFLQTYKSFSDTSFVSLYAANTWAEEFAELNTFRYLVEEMKLNYIISIKKSGKTVFTYEPMKSEKVKKRIEIIIKYKNVKIKL